MTPSPSHSELCTPANVKDATSVQDYYTGLRCTPSQIRLAVQLLISLSEDSNNISH